MAEHRTTSRSRRTSQAAVSSPGRQAAEQYLAACPTADDAEWSQLLDGLCGASNAEQVESGLRAVFLRGLEAFCVNCCDWADEDMDALVTALTPLFSEFGARIVFDPAREIGGSVPEHAVLARVGDWEGLVHPGVIRYRPGPPTVIVPVEWSMGWRPHS